MKENTEQEQQTPAPKRGMSDFKKAMMWTAIPIVVFSAISTGGSIANPASVAFGIVSAVAAGLWGLAILACIGFAIARKRQIAAGILAGVGIGVLALGASCFALLVTNP